MKKKMLISGCILVLAATLLLTGCHASPETLSSAEGGSGEYTDVPPVEDTPMITTSTTADATVDTTASGNTTVSASTTAAMSVTTAAATTVRTTAAPTTKAPTALTTAKPTTPTTKRITTNKPATTKKTTTTTKRTTAKPGTTTAQANASAKQQEVFRLVNEARAKAGLSALKYCYAAQDAADIRAAEIIQKFSHTRPDNTECFTVLDGIGVRYWAAGENIAAGQTTPEWVMDSWMNSEGHKANILNSNYNAIVVGVKDNHWVQLFLQVVE